MGRAGRMTQDGTGVESRKKAAIWDEGRETIACVHD